MNLQDLINKSEKALQEREEVQQRKGELLLEIAERNEELHSIENESSFCLNDGVYDIGLRAVLERCENCTKLEDQINHLGDCVKCRYNYDSYFEER